MDLKQLEYFVRVAELGGFTRAAIVLDIAQPALSRQVRLLEVEFGQNFLIRNGRGVTVTDSGKLMLEYGRGILYRVERLREELGRARGTLNGHVAIGLPPSLVKALALPIFRDFKENFPAASLSIREGMSSAVQESLISGRLDVALLYNASQTPDIELTALLEEELFFVAPKNYETSESMSLLQLPTYPLIAPGRPNAIRTLIECELANYGLKPTIAFEVDSLSAILRLVNEGFGYAILSKQAVANFSGNMKFNLIPISGTGLKATLSLAINSHRQVTATQEELIKLLTRTVSQYL